MPSAPAVLLQTLSLFALSLITATSAEPIPTVFVGDSISCDCGGVEGRWSLNGVDINVTASQIQDTISVVNGSFNYDGRLDCDSGGNPCEFKALGLLGVSPSPSNCSSVDNTTNTCTVTAAVGSSLTLCVDFMHYPSDAPRFAEIATTVWRRSDTEEWFWYCSYGSCTKNLNSYSMNISISSSGACAHVESVQKNNSVLFLFRGDPHPVGKHLELHRQAGLFNDVTFSIQVTPQSATASQPNSVSSVASSSRGAPSAFMLTTTMMNGVTSLMPSPTGISHPPTVPSLQPRDTQSGSSGQTAVGVAFAVLLCLSVITTITTGLCVYVCHFKKGYLKSTQEGYIKPQVQKVTLEVTSVRSSVPRPSNLQLMEIANVGGSRSTLHTTSTMNTYLSRGSEGLPSFYHTPESTVPEKTPPGSLQTASLPPYTSWPPEAPDSDSEWFYGGLGSNSEIDV